MEVTVQKELYRRATVEWTCFSWKQLEYLTPYFLVPRITCMIEWGWNHYNPQSLVNLSDKALMRQLWDNTYPLYTNNIIKSKGNYDVIYGFITNFNWSMEGNKIICSTEITSKDRLYAGVAKDYGISVTDEKSDTKNGIFQSIKTFVNNNDTINNLRGLTQIPIAPFVTVSRETIIGENFRSLEVTTTPQGKPLNNLALNSKNINLGIWSRILIPFIKSSIRKSRWRNHSDRCEETTTSHSGIFGTFGGRPIDSYITNENFGYPKTNDFDYTQKNISDLKKFWVNMGLVVEILNSFSALPSGGKNGKNMFQVDIMNSVIGSHPNLISCDQRVLIPNYKAPKFHYGLIGLQNNTVGTTPDPKYPYSYQVTTPISITKNSSIQDQKLKETFIQPGNACFRDNLDAVINYNRYRWAKFSNNSSPFTNYSFPSHGLEKVIMPPSPYGLAGNKSEDNWSGFLSNIYISFDLLKDAVNDDSNVSYMDIYKNILNVLMSTSNGFWDLALVDVDGIHTIVDKRYAGKYSLKTQPPIYSFDYSDADSIIKSLKFRPVLSNLQATRVIFGEVNNPRSKYKYIDKNDMLDYHFTDAVIGTEEDLAQGDAKSELDQRQTEKTELKSMLTTVQIINSHNDDGSLQMSLNPFQRNNTPPPNTSTERVEVVKLVLPDPQLLRLLLNDGDENNNPRYCRYSTRHYFGVDFTGNWRLKNISGFYHKKSS